ncbi:MAG TPA: ATP--guanido phosphotransferase [Lentisphaeria bacterium]|nr:ATP--guanido phosphotransferase [Lentisphaeria bacterium]
MRTDIREMAAANAPWLSVDADDSDVVFSSRIRLARNIARWPFPPRAEPHDREAVLEATRESLLAHAQFSPTSEISFDGLEKGDRRVLIERRLATKELFDGRPGCAIFVAEDEAASVMVNEEDHLRIQSILPGLQLDLAYDIATAIDDHLSTDLGIAFHDDLGYLTSCPSNVGTGLRASVMLHLPGLVLAETINECLAAIQQLGLAVRGVAGEGSETHGNLFQLSNQSTLGETEAEIISGLARATQHLVNCERNARKKLVEQVSDRLADYVGRAFGCLQHAHWLTTDEALMYLSALRLGTDMKMFSQMESEWVNGLWLAVQSGHLQARDDGTGPRAKRPVRRARLVRARLAEVTRPD